MSFSPISRLFFVIFLLLGLSACAILDGDDELEVAATEPTASGEVESKVADVKSEEAKPEEVAATDVTTETRAAAAPKVVNGSVASGIQELAVKSASAAEERELYRIGVDDKVQITVRGNSAFDTTVPVRPDGKISIPLAGDILVGGRTPQQVSEIITNFLGKYIRSPNATVIVTELRSHEYLRRVRVTGAVSSPSSMPFRTGMTVLDAVLASGGINEFGAGNKTKIYRKIDGISYVSTIKLEDILKKGEMETNILLSPGDIITVPERLF